MFQSRKWLAAAALTTLPAIMPAAQAQSYPDKPIKVLVGFPAGGSADIVARMVTEVVSRASGMEFVVENRTGAGGNLAFEATAQAQPDGYTLLFSTPGVAINPSLYRNVKFKTEDFTPITYVGESPLLLMVRPSLGVRDLQGLIKLGRTGKDAVRFASSGNGSTSHLAGEVFRAMAGIQYLHVPYRGGGPATVDLIGDRVDMTLLPIAESMPYVRDGKLVALGQTAAQRSSIAPDIPTIDEAGVPDYSVATWYVLLGPRNLPAAVVDKLHSAFSQAVGSPALKTQLESRGVNVINAGPADTARFLQTQSDTWAKTIQAAGIQLN